MAERELIFFVGNCQSRVLSQIFGRIPGVAERYEIAYMANYLALANAPNNPAALDLLKKMYDFVEANRARIRLFVWQRTHGWFGEELTQAHFNSHTEIVGHPVCLLNYIWPLAGATLVGDEKAQAHFPLSILDSEVLRLKAEGVREEHLLERYHEIDVLKTFRVDRLRRINTIKAEEVDRISSFPIWPFIEASMCEAQMFRLMNHPNGVLLAELLARIGEHMSIEIDRPAFDAKVEETRKSHGVQLIEAPIHPRIVEHFDLRWARGKSFNFWGHAELTFEQYLLRIYRLDYDADYRKALDFIRDRDFERAIEAMRQVIARVPDNQTFRDQLVRFKRMQALHHPDCAAARAALAENRFTAAVASFERAVAVMPTNEFAAKELAQARAVLPNPA